MKKIFLDTNVLIDLVLCRERYDQAVSILEGAYEGHYAICASVLSFANIAYILRKETQERLYQLMKVLEETVPMLPMMPDDVSNAIGHPVKDFEDMLQYQCAISSGCDIIVTNNKRDFQEFCTLPLRTTEEFLHDSDIQN